MTVKEHKTKLSLVELVTGEQDLLKGLMREALQTVLEGEMTEFLGAAPDHVAPCRTGAAVCSFGIDHPSGETAKRPIARCSGRLAALRFVAGSGHVPHRALPDNPGAAHSDASN